MTDQTVPELTGFQAAAAELHRIADAIGDLPCSRKKPYLSLAILPTAGDSSTDQKIADVDAVAMAVLGKPAETVENSPGNWFRLVREERGGIYIAVQGAIPSPHVNELEQLRARVAELEAARSAPVDQDAEDAAAFDRGFMAEHRRVAALLVDETLVHFLEPGVDGDDDDRMACGERFGDAVKTGAFTGVEADVTCPACRTSAQLDHTKACRDQDADRPCRLDCPARGAR